MKTYYILLSCENIFIEGISIQKYLEDRISKKDISIVCIPKHTDIAYSKTEIDDLAGSSIYVLNTNEELDNVNNWELGYVMGKGLKVICYPGEKWSGNIPDGTKSLINPIPRDINEFLRRIRFALANLPTKEEIIREEEWNQQPKYAKKEIEGGI